MFWPLIGGLIAFILLAVFMGWLRAQRPDLVPRYLELYRRGAYAPQGERSVLWNDPQIGIDWPDAGTPILSAKDAAGKPLLEAEVFA